MKIMKIEILEIIVVIVLLLLLILSIKSKTNLLKNNNDLIYQQEVTYKQLSYCNDINLRLESENVKLHSSIQDVKDECSYMVDDIKDSYNKIKNKNISLVKRLNCISADNGLRNVIGSRYKVGESLYHISPKTGKIEKHKVSTIEFNDYGTEYDVDYFFKYKDLEYPISEDSCFKDEGVAKMMLVERP